MMLEPCCHRFTAAEGGARLAATAAAKNTLVTECGAFISTRLLHEEAYNIRGLLSAGRQRSVRISRAINVKPDAYELRILTDLKVTMAQTYEDVEDWNEELETKEVLVCASEVLKWILEEGVLTMAQINVLIIDSCHLIYKDDNLQYIMKVYKQSAEDKRPRILALTYPLFSSNKKDIDNTETEEPIDNMQICEKETVEETVETIDSVENDKNTVDQLEEIGVYENLDDFEMYEKLEWKIDQLEQDLCCRMDLAEDIDGCKRISGPVTKPKELVIEFGVQPSSDPSTSDYAELEVFMRTNVQDTLDFLNDHRHDPTEIYGEELYEEFKNIPDPTIEPKQTFKEFLYVLEELGPYAADKAAFNLLIKLEKSKIKVPYERHFLLLRLCTSIFVKIRCYAELIFNKYTSDWDKIKLFSTPKLLRFVEILEQFTPPDQKENILDQTASEQIQTDQTDTAENESNESKDSNVPKMDTEKLLKDIDQCDFTTLGNKIEDRLNTFEANLKDLDQMTASGTLVNKDDENLSLDPRFLKPGARRWGRARGRRPPRNVAARLLHQQHPWALCGIVFVQHALMAKIMFMLCVDLSRCRQSLAYLRCQYCAVEPVSEQKESQRQGKRHEEVLKKFRMHECNLLLTTSALEEGIDLPRCNLVLRWDVPASYRSYGLCRARGRAPRASAAVLCAHAAAAVDTDAMLHNLATYTELDQLITRKCGCGIQDEPSAEEEAYADAFTSFIKPYTPSDTPTNIHKVCQCKDKAGKDIENRMKKIRITEIARNSGGTVSETILRDVSETVESVSETVESVSETVEDVSETVEDVSETYIESVPKSINSVLKSNKHDLKYKENDENDSVSKFMDKSAIESTISTPISIQSVSQFVSKHFENISDVVDSVSKSIESVSKSIESVSETIDCVSETLECDFTKDTNKMESYHQEVLRENIKNIEISRLKSDDHYNSDNKGDDIDKDNKCSCNSDNNNLDSKESDVVSVDLSTAIALINRYCAKLPSDTFTRLAPQWWMERVLLPGATRDSYVCTLRLPLNCPLKYNIVGHPMPTRVLARRMVALQACRILHKSGELDNQLMPIGKENFKAAELETNVFKTYGEFDNEDSARPGTTKRRQYYYKRTAAAFTDCQPVVDTSDSEIEPRGDKPQAEPGTRAEAIQDTGGKRNMLYAIASSLWCALPERYNTRGRRLHAPQHARQALGILMARTEPTSLQIPAFPVYTRSGEVRVSVEHVPDADVRVSPRRGRLVRRFMRFVFTEVLRVRRRGMKLQSEGSTKNNYYIVPTIKITRADGSSKIDIDWPFLELIYQHTEEKKHSDIEKPLPWRQDEEETQEESCDAARAEGESEGEGERLASPLLREGETFVFDVEKYSEAVVTPWYRNRDQPQFFLVAEICWSLSPDSAFPSATHDSFRSYYRAKYSVALTQPRQPLLDVDHTSARLNLLTPR